MVTSNHVHLLVFDTGKRDVIPKPMQLVAGQTGKNIIRERIEGEHTGKIMQQP
jgi:hypothetical protein